MTSRKSQRAVYLVTAAIVAAMVGGYALAATATQPLTHSQGSSQGTTAPGSLIAGYTWTNAELVVLLENTDPMLGTSTGVGNSLGGSQLALTGCATATCSQNNEPALGPTEAVGDYAEEIILTVTQGVAAPETESKHSSWLPAQAAQHRPWSRTHLPTRGYPLQSEAR